MKAKQTVILFLATLALSLSAADSTNRLSFPVAGFSITPLEVPPGKTICQPLIMSLPATGNFAGNVNVQIQPYSGTIAEYTTLTLKQFKDAGVKVIEQKKAGTAGVVFEYSGELQAGRSTGTPEPKRRQVTFTLQLPRPQSKSGRGKVPSSRPVWIA